MEFSHFKTAAQFGRVGVNARLARRLALYRRLAAKAVADLAKERKISADDLLQYHLPGEHDQLDHAPKNTGGSTASFTDKTHPATRRVITAEREIAEKDKEHLVAVNASGKVVFKKIGNKDRVTIDIDEGAKLTDAKVTHNHPGGGPLSSDDITTAALHDFSEIRAIGRTKFGTDLYAMRRPQGGWPKDWKGIDGADNLFNEIKKEAVGLRKKYRNKINGGEMSLREAQTTALHEITLRIAKRRRIAYARIPIGK